jgi:predicted component of type VI protein secretion system
MKSICRLLAVLGILAIVLSACSAGQPDQTLQQAYSVTVTDAEGNPISGVMVQL